MSSQSPDVSAFVEAHSMLWEASGLPRIAGRILGWLLVCQPAEQTASDLAKALSASRASISTNTRLLEHFGIVERTARIGTRSTLFRIAPGAWTRVMRNENARARRFREIAEQGLKLLPETDATDRSRLTEFHQIWSFMEQELPGLLDRYEHSNTK